MNMRARRIGVLGLAFVLGGCGFTGNLRMDPGFASFRTPSTLPGTERELAVSVGPVPIRLATLISRPLFRKEEPWITDTLETVRAVRVYSYETHGHGGVVGRHLETTRGELIARGWHPIVAVRDDGGRVLALVRQRERAANTVRGLVVMIQDDGQLTLINVMGKFTPAAFNTIMAGLGIEAPPVSFGTTI